MATTQTEFDPPLGMKYIYQGHEIQFSYRGFGFKGVLGFVLKVDKESDLAGNQASYAVDWRKAEGTVLILGALVIIVADLVKDGASLGAGAAESPLSFLAAARMFSAGVTMFRSYAR